MAITRLEAIAVVLDDTLGIKAATWRRKTNKKENRCPYCNDTLARHAQEWVCNDHGVVRAERKTIAAIGDLIRRTFISSINPEKKTKNWTGVTMENSGKDGQYCNAATKEEADAIKRRHGLVVVLKMGGVGDDKKGVPISIPVFDLETLTWNGETHEITD